MHAPQTISHQKIKMIHFPRSEAKFIWLRRAGEGKTIFNSILRNIHRRNIHGARMD